MEMKALLFAMLRIRKVQLAIEGRYLENEMKTPIHLYIGQEGIAAGVCAHLEARDYINSTHRSHGHYLAKGGDLRALMAELHGKETGCSRGRGGSMHLVDPAVGHYGSSAIVGGGLAIGVGMGLAIKMKKRTGVSVIFFGDGAADEGVFYESVNFAVLKKLPVVFVLENNQFSVCSRVSARQPGDNVFHKMPAKLLFTRIIDGNDVLAVFNVARTAVKRARKGHGPSLLECRTYRILGHSGCKAQDAPGYRSREEVYFWQSRCPVDLFRAKLRADGLITEHELEEMGKKIDDQIEDAFAFARQSPLPAPEALPLYLYRE